MSARFFSRSDTTGSFLSSAAVGFVRFSTAPLVVLVSAVDPVTLDNPATEYELLGAVVDVLFLTELLAVNAFDVTVEPTVFAVEAEVEIAGRRFATLLVTTGLLVETIGVSVLVRDGAQAVLLAEKSSVDFPGTFESKTLTREFAVVVGTPCTLLTVVGRLNAGVVDVDASEFRAAFLAGIAVGCDRSWAEKVGAVLTIVLVVIAGLTKEDFEVG